MARLLLIIALAASACASRASRWDAYSDAEPLRVRGMRPTAPGPTIFRALENDPAARRVIAANGEPETLEVVTTRNGEKRIVLVYRSAREPGLRRIELDPPRTIRSATVPAPPRRVASRRSAPQAAGADPPAPVAGPPSARQSLECPIDPDRPDCRALCGRGAHHEWCP